MDSHQDREGRSRSRGRLATGATLLAGVAALAALLGASQPYGALVGTSTTPAAAHAARGAVATPYSVRLTKRVFATAPSTAQCRLVAGAQCYTPKQIEVAYDMRSLYAAGDNGKGETIVLVDSFGSPTIASDLATFDKEFGLPAPPSLKVVTPSGAVPKWRASPAQVAWGIETTLDVEWAHAMAPGADLVLAETPVNETEGTVGFPQIVTAEKWVINHLDPAVISQSFGATEQTFPSERSIRDLRGAFELAQRRGVTVLAASGDAGATSQRRNGVDLYLHRAVGWPSSDPLVTSVGGTHLDLNAKGARLAPDTVWNDSSSAGGPAASNGGLSTVFSRPAWQDGVAGVVGARRGVPDVSMSASDMAGAIVYASFPGVSPGYEVVGGTSWATPLFAGVVAIADQVVGRHLGLLNPLLYELASEGGHGIVDITSGDNTVSFFQGGALHTVQGYSATKGYDLASGLGTVDGAKFVRELAALAQPAARPR